LFAFDFSFIYPTADVLTVTASHALALTGPPTEDKPEGVQLNLVFGSSKARNAFFDLAADWRDAAAYGL